MALLAAAHDIDVFPPRAATGTIIIIGELPRRIVREVIRIG